jgi:O-antigen/teichoic acid export membrane protein
VATRLLQLGLLAAFSVGQAVEPRFGETIAADDLGTTKSLYAISTAWLIMLTWPMYILLAIFAPSAMGIFGSGFVSGSGALVILSGAVILGAGVGPVDILLVMKGKSTWSLWNTGLAAGLSIVLNLILIPILGVVGAAISLATSRVVANLLPLAQLNHLANLHPFGDTWARAALTSSLIFGGVGLIVKFALGSGLTAAITAGVIAALAYVPVLWRSRALIGLDPKIILGNGSIA